MGTKAKEDNRKSHGSYLVYKDGTVIDIRTGKLIKKHLRKGRYVVGLKLTNSSTRTYIPLHRLLFSLFVNPEITRYDYIIPKDGDYENLALEDWEECPISTFHHTKRTNSGRKKIVCTVMEKEILHMHKDGLSLRKIAALTNVSSCNSIQYCQWEIP